VAPNSLGQLELCGTIIGEAGCSSPLSIKDSFGKIRMGFGWLATWYRTRLKEWAESYLAEIAKGVLVLFGLAVFRVAILAVRLTGIDPGYLTSLEELDFWFQYATIAALGLYSLLKFVSALL